jgi:hypothetical protein
MAGLSPTVIRTPGRTRESHFPGANALSLLWYFSDGPLFPHIADGSSPSVDLLMETWSPGYNGELDREQRPGPLSLNVDLQVSNVGFRVPKMSIAFAFHFAAPFLFFGGGSIGAGLLHLFSPMNSLIYFVCMMTYSGSLFVQLGYWFIETYCLEHFDHFPSETAMRR